MTAEAVSRAEPTAALRFRRPVNPGRIVAWTLLAMGGITMIMPFVFMISTSLKFPHEIYDLRLIPNEPTLSNYAYVLADGRFFRWFLNSFLIAFATTASVLFFDSLVGYTLCKFKFRGRGIVFVAILSTLMIPTEMLVIPWYLMSQSLGWLDSYWGIMFPGIMTGFGTFLMRQFFESVPDDFLDAARIDDLELVQPVDPDDFLDAARIDGLNEFQIWWEVAMPLVTPALSALAIFVFLGNWTAFLWPLIVTNSTELYTIPVGLASFSVETQVQWELIMTGSALATIPTLIVFLLFQRYIIRGVMLTGLKG